MAFLGLLEPFSGERRAGHTGIQHGVAVVFQPLLQQSDVSGPADAVGAFQNNELALELSKIYIREPFAKVAKSSHLLTCVFLVPASVSDTMRRTSSCCSSIERVASMVTRPNSS